MKKKIRDFSLDVFNRNLSFHPWIFFLIFLVSNSLLSFAPLSLMARSWIAILGIVLPFSFALKIIYDNPEPKGLSFHKEFFLPPAWLWYLFFFLLVFTRLYRLTTLPFWPLSDEGISGFLGLEQSEHWRWKLLWAHDRVEPMLIWTLGVYFKAIEPSLLSLRFLPVLFSIATVLTGYWAARQYFSKSISFLFGWVLAFSFWTLTLSRICLIPIPVPFFQCLCFGLLGLFLKSKTSASKLRCIIFLGFFAGMGFYTWSNWAAVWLSLTAILLASSWVRKERFIFPGFFLAASALVALPLTLARLGPGEMSHFQHLVNFTPWKQLFTYFSGIFWDGSTSFPFGSNWGGFINPLLGSLVFIGSIFLAQTAGPVLIAAIAACIFFSILPGVFANGIDLHRVLPLFPFLMLLSVWGLQGLFRRSAQGLTLAGITFLSLASFGLDGHNYLNHYSNLTGVPQLRQWRSVEYHHAYQILLRQEKLTGPLYVFSEFNTDYDNKTLNVACYPFDALQNPALSHSTPQWAAVITNIHYAPYLISRFPNLKFEVLKSDKSEQENRPPFGIFLIPRASIPDSSLSRWIQADRICHNVSVEIKNKRTIDPWNLYSDYFSALKEIAGEDHFLTALYWEKTGFFKFLGGQFFEASEAFQRGINRGIQAAHLYYSLGVCLKKMGRETEAKDNFIKAEKLSAIIY